MNKEELLKSCMKEVILDNWKSKLGYPFNHKDLEELESIVDYYEEENFNLREGIFVEKMSFPSENRNFKELMEMPTYQKLHQENKELHNKIDKAIEILKEHFVEEYIRSCDTSDGVGRYEIDTEHWTYKVYEQLKDSDVDE